MTTSYNANVAYGRALMDLVGGVVPAFGDVHVVVSTSDTSDPNYQKLWEVFKPSNGFVRFWTSLEDAYAAATSNNNDVILLDAHSTHSISTGILWSKSRIHLIGMDGGDHLVQQGAKVQLSGNVASAYVVKVTGNRNSFRNVKFIQASTNAAALTVVQDGGEGSVYKNCSFVFGVANNLGGTTAHEFLAGSDSATYLNCTFGSDTLLTSGARSVFHIKQVTTGQEFKSNILKECNFLISSSSATAAFVRLDAVGDILFTNVFDHCNFVASVDSAGGIALAEVAQTGTGTVKGGLYFAFPAAFNVANFSTATGGRNENIQCVSPQSVANAQEGIKPTA